jgi:glyoxylase-like metal-dependent hydrolase (beta-lactamase superfamily II)
MPSARLCFLAVWISGCGPYAPARAPQLPPLTDNHEMETLERAVAWPHPSTITTMMLVNEYLSGRHHRRGYDYFAARAKAAPEDPLFLTLAGLFQARSADEVALLQRVAWVEDATRKLDRAVTIAKDGGLERYLRGFVLAELPARFGRATSAVADLEWMLAHRAQFPPGLSRGAYAGLAKAYATLGRGAEADDARAHAGAGGSFLSDFAVSATDGFRFGPRELIEPAKGVLIARGYDFADLAFVLTDDGIVAIDGGTTVENVKAALVALRTRTQLPIRHVIVTHAHWDHVGGLAALLEPGTEVIAQSGYAGELENANTASVPFHYFFGARAHGPYTLSPTRLIAERQSLTIGGKRFSFSPVHGGETNDALLVNLPDAGVMFVGDVFMPYFGAPFVNEGSVEGLLETIKVIRDAAPTELVHGHTPLTLNFTLAALEPLSAALTSLLQSTSAAIHDGKPLADTLALDLLPDALRTHPEAVTPFLLMRDNAIKRLYAQRTGYWKANGEGVEVFTAAELGRAVDLVAGGRADAFLHASEALEKRGDFAMALKLATLGLAAHPDDEALRSARAQALADLRAKNQLGNPFKFIVYSEMAGRELPSP